MNTDTPETDSHYYPDFEMGGDVVLADFARKLERERDEAREANKERDDLEKAVNGLCEHFGVIPANTTLLAVELLKIQRERDEWKAKFIQQNKDLGCEQMDPNGTIWDHAQTLQRERDEAQEALAAEIKHHAETTAKWNGHHMDLTITQCDLNKAIRELDEARGQLAGIESKMRVELGGHPDSELWGEAGLIAATMRCVDALGEVTDQRNRLAGALRIIADGTSCRECGGEDQALLARESLQSLFCDALQSLTPNETLSNQ